MVLKLDFHSKTSKSHICRRFYDIIKITSSKTRHQNDVIKTFHFKAPPLTKSWLRSWFEPIFILFQPTKFKGGLWLEEKIFLQKNVKRFSEHKPKNYAWKFLTATEKSSKSWNNFTQLWRQWPCLLQIKICI